MKHHTQKESSNEQFLRLRNASLSEVRTSIRKNLFTGRTAGLADKKLQANLVILPHSFASDFQRYCALNPKPCPLIGYSETGSPHLKTIDAAIDIRTDIPRYYLYRDGVLSRELTEITQVWQDDFVVFALGCSFSFEHALLREGIDLWHITHNTTVPMYLTNISTTPVGPFHGKSVVSMRAIPNVALDRVFDITSQYPLAHGSPIHMGDPKAIGIDDLTKPDWGDAAPVLENHTAVFWACGVTPQVAIQEAKLPVAITHKPGHMLILDIDECHFSS